MLIPKCRQQNDFQEGIQILPSTEIGPAKGSWGQGCVRQAAAHQIPGWGAQSSHPPGLTHLVVYEAHVPGVERGCPLAAVAGVDGSGQLLQRPLVVRVELVGQGEMQLLGARLHRAVCERSHTGTLTRWLYCLICPLTRWIQQVWKQHRFTLLLPAVAFLQKPMFSLYLTRAREKAI